MVVGATKFGTKLEVTIHEGKNRQVRKMFEAVSCTVNKLKRTREAGLNLGHIPLGRWRKLTESEVNMLKKIGTGKKSSREMSESIFGKDYNSKSAGKSKKSPAKPKGKKTKYSGSYKPQSKKFDK